MDRLLDSTISMWQLILIVLVLAALWFIWHITHWHIRDTKRPPLPDPLNYSTFQAYEKALDEWHARYNGGRI